MSLQKNRKIFFLFPYPKGKAPGQRFRYEQYIEVLKEHKSDLYFFTFLDDETNAILYKKGFGFQKFWGIVTGMYRRLMMLPGLVKADYVFVFREAAPIGPPIFEWLIAKVFRKRIIYDFDDSIWLTDKVNEGPLEKIVRWRSKVGAICRWSYKVSCGNEYLAAFAKQYNSKVIVNPTTIDTEYLHNPSLHANDIRNDKVVIGWTGTHSTLKYLAPLVPVMQKLEKKYPQLEFLVIANKKPEFDLRSLVFIPWSEDSEIRDLLKIDIGVMPLPDDEWARGKCGFKALQYMALKIPTIASPVGVNTKIVDDGVNGYLCTDMNEWYTRLDQLINSGTLRSKIGIAGRVTVENHYSVISNSDNFLSLFV